MLIERSYKEHGTGKEKTDIRWVLPLRVDYQLGKADQFALSDETGTVDTNDIKYRVAIASNGGFHVKSVMPCATGARILSITHPHSP